MTVLENLASRWSTPARRAARRRPRRGDGDPGARRARGQAPARRPGSRRSRCASSSWPARWPPAEAADLRRGDGRAVQRRGGRHPGHPVPAQRARHHHHHDRAHHAGGDALLRAHRRARRRRADRRGHARTRSSATPRWRGPTLASSIIVRNVDAGYGAVRVLHGVSLEVRDGETVALLGTNGNGKSTLIKCIMGMVRPSRGEIVLEIDGARDRPRRASRPRRSSASASRWCRRGAACSPSSRSRRTCCSAPTGRRRGRNIAAQPRLLLRGLPGAARARGASSPAA